jgi:hypothetical protein
MINALSVAVVVRGFPRRGLEQSDRVKTSLVQAMKMLDA